MKLSRNQKGIIAWFIIGIIFSFIIAFPTMFVREIYQWKYQNTTNFDFELDGIIRYGISIAAGQVVQLAMIILFII